jgi:hypothetical protein
LITSEDVGVGGTVIKDETGYTVAHVQPMEFDPLTPVLVSLKNYDVYANLSVEETEALIDALNLALMALGMGE